MYNHTSPTLLPGQQLNLGGQERALYRDSSIWRLPHRAGGQQGHLHGASTSLLSFALGSSGFKRWPLSCPRDARCIAATKTHAKQTAPDDTACGHTCFTTFLVWRGRKRTKNNTTTSSVSFASRMRGKESWTFVYWSEMTISPEQQQN